MNTSRQKWYVAVLIVEIGVHGQRERRPLFDRQIRLVTAASHEQAYKKALRLGREENRSYLNPKGDIVRWKFVGLADLDLMRGGKLTDGVEVYSGRERGNPHRDVRRKRELEIFWYEANKRRKLGGLIAPGHRRYMPSDDEWRSVMDAGRTKNT